MDGSTSSEETTDPFEGDDTTDLEDHVTAAEAAEAYRSHDPSQVPPPHLISLEDEPPEMEPPEPQQSSYPAKPQPASEPQRLDLGLNAPFSNAFFVSLGWSAGRMLIRLVILLTLFAVIGLMLWNVIN